MYARLLSNELAYVYKGPLLVVMPQGFATRHVPAATAGLLTAWRSTRPRRTR